MQNWSGARPVDAPTDVLVLLLSVRLTERGQVIYTYSVAPGRVVSVVTRPGPSMLPPDDPAILAEVAYIEGSARGYTATDDGGAVSGD